MNRGLAVRLAAGIIVGAAMLLVPLLLGDAPPELPRATTDTTALTTESVTSAAMPGPAVDVAGQFALAANTDFTLLNDAWSWGVVPVGIAVDKGGGLVWAQYRTNTLEKADPSGNRRGRLAVVDGPLGVAIDRQPGHVYFSTDRHYPRAIGRILRDGARQVLAFGERVNRPFAMAIDESRDTLFWVENINGRIRSSALDGSDLRTLFDDGVASGGEAAEVAPLTSVGIAVTPEAGKLFWSDLRTGSIWQANLDGSARTRLLGHERGLVFPTALAIDPLQGKLYWADPGAESISRVNFDGSEFEVVADSGDGVLEPYGLAVDAERRTVYWTDVARDGIYRSRSDRSSVELFIDLNPSGAAGRTPEAALRRNDEVLLRWMKGVRTCVVAIGATKATMRDPGDLVLPARACIRTLAGAPALAAAAEHETSPSRAAHNNGGVRLRLGAAIVAADLPRASRLLREIRPVVERSTLAGAQAATAQIDALLHALAGLERRPPVANGANVPATGQSTTYLSITRGADVATRVADDGMLRHGVPLQHIDNGDGTLTDPTTGLIWEKKCAGCDGLHSVDTRLAVAGGDGATTVTDWLQAINSVDGTGLAGHDDWRLPETDELVGLVDFETFNPAVTESFYTAGCSLGCASSGDSDCSCTALGDYWTAATAGDVVPVVAFHLGLVWGRRPDETAFVRAVRGPQPKHGEHFVDNGDGTATDLETGLMWEKKCRCPGSLHDVERKSRWSFDGSEETVWDWLDSVNAEGGSGFAGFDDWRLPNVKELYSLYVAQPSGPGVAAVLHSGCERPTPQGCSVTAESLHWTSTTFADFPSLALAVGFGSPRHFDQPAPPWVTRVAGAIEPHEKTARLVVRAVRGPVSAAR